LAGRSVRAAWLRERQIGSEWLLNFLRQLRRHDYFRAVATLVKVVFRDEPKVLTTVTIAIEMPAAIRPYSIAVAPVRLQEIAST
jgi:hypothetical protein